LLAAIFRLLGVSLFSGRILLAFDVAVMAGLIFWLSSKIASQTTALCATLLFGALAFARPNNFVVNHRWDSGALALVAIAAALSMVHRPRHSAAAAAGVFAVASFWVTPATGLLAAAIFAWMLIDSLLRFVAWSYLAGILVTTFVPATVLLLQGGLVPMWRSFIWTSTNYSGANRMAYGAVFGNPITIIMTMDDGIQRVRTTILFLVTLLPAILPPAMVIAWALLLRKANRQELF
jgi:hypothetical protein